MRLAPVLRALAAWLLMWLVAPRLVRPALRLLLGPPPHMVRHSHVLVAGALLRNEVASILAVLLAVACVLASEPARLTLARLVERSNLPTTRAAWRTFPLGLLAGFGAMGTVIGAMALTGHAHLLAPTAAWPAVLRTFVAFSVAFLLVGLSEELHNRGYVLRALTEGIGFLAASVVTSSWFAATHLLEGDPWTGALGTGLRGFFDCLTWRATGSLAFAIGFHAAWDWTQTALFGVPDSSFTVPAALLTTHLSGPAWLSGGIVGPEGSVFAYAVTAVLIALAWRWCRR